MQIYQESHSLDNSIPKKQKKETNAFDTTSTFLISILAKFIECKDLFHLAVTSTLNRRRVKGLWPSTLCYLHSIKLLNHNAAEVIFREIYHSTKLTCIWELKEYDDQVQHMSFLAARTGDLEVLKVIFSSKILKESDFGKMLFHATSHGQSTLIGPITKAGPSDPFIASRGAIDYATLAFIAAKGGYLNVLIALKEAGINIDSRFKKNRPGICTSDSTALLQATFDQNKQAVTTLIAAGANVNATFDDGGTSLMLAAVRGDQDIVTKLIEARADVNAQNRNGNTPLKLAEKKGFKDITTKLIEAGARA